MPYILKKKSIICKQNSKCRLCVDKDEMTNRISNVQKEYKTRHNWVEKVILWELCKKLKSDHTTKWYMLKLEFVQKE